MEEEKKKEIQDSGEEKGRMTNCIVEISNQSLNDPRGKRNQPTNG
jgi:hypothetical protein